MPRKSGERKKWEKESEAQRDEACWKESNYTDMCVRVWVGLCLETESVKHKTELPLLYYMRFDNHYLRMQFSLPFSSAFHVVTHAFREREMEQRISTCVWFLHFQDAHWIIDDDDLLPIRHIHFQSIRVLSSGWPLSPFTWLSYVLLYKLNGKHGEKNVRQWETMTQNEKVFMSSSIFYVVVVIEHLLHSRFFT